MILASSERGSFEGTKFSQMGDNVVATKEELSVPTNFDLTSFAYQNREAVSFENASINVDNSTDVIFGPVTHFNVNGNVTIVQNGNGDEVDSEDNEKKTSVSSYGAAKLQKTEKSPSEDQAMKFLIQNKKIIKILVAIITSLFFVIAIIAVILIEMNGNTDDESFTIPPTTHAENLENHHQLLSKKDWNGRAARSYENITRPVKMVIIKHTGGGTCNNFQECAGKVQTIQGADIAKGRPDIYCNFLIGGDGNVYVGRGWDVRNEQRDSTIDIAYMGNFDIDEFTDSMAEAGLLLIQAGVKKNKLPKNYKLVCHNQTMNQRSPGVNIIKAVASWPNYDNGTYIADPLER